MNFRTRQLKRTLEPLMQALDSHRRSLEGLERAFIEFEEGLRGQKERPERPQAKQDGEGGGGGLELLSITDVCQELGMGKGRVYRRIESGEIPSFTPSRCTHKFMGIVPVVSRRVEGGYAGQCLLCEALGPVRDNGETARAALLEWGRRNGE